MPVSGSLGVADCGDPALPLQLDDEDDAVHQRGEGEQHEAEAHAEVGGRGLCIGAGRVQRCVEVALESIPRKLAIFTSVCYHS